MLWAGSLMSQVLQCTQFCALMTKRGSVRLRLVGVDHLVDAGRAIEPRRLAVFRQIVADRDRRDRSAADGPADPPRDWCSTGTPRRTCRTRSCRPASDRRSASRRKAASACRCRTCRASACRTASRRRSSLVHMSRPPSGTPSARPSLLHSGLTLRTFFRSRPMSELAPALLVGDEFVVGAARGERLVRRLGRLDARQHRVVRALDAGEIDEAGGAADAARRRGRSGAARIASRRRRSRARRRRAACRPRTCRGSADGS